MLQLTLYIAPPNAKRSMSMPQASQRGRRDMSGKVYDAVIALAACHNVGHSMRRGLELKSNF